MHKTLLDVTVTDKKCSYGYMLDHGATTLWEYWDKAGETFNSQLRSYAVFDSQNHCMLGGGVTSWMFQGLAGIRAKKAGYQEVELRPGLESELTWVKSSVDTLRGKIVSEWNYQNNVFDWNIVVPTNVLATIYIPIQNATVITESGIDIFEKDGNSIRYLKKEEGSFIYQLGGGTYHIHVVRSEI